MIIACSIETNFKNVEMKAYERDGVKSDGMGGGMPGPCRSGHRC